MSPLHILLLHADEAARQDLAAILRAAGHVVASESEARAAAAALVTPPGGAVPAFGVLVLDLSAPDLDLTVLRHALAPGVETPPDSLDATESRHIARMLRFTDGNRRRAALLLGISRSTLLNKIRKYGLSGAE